MERIQTHAQLFENSKEIVGHYIPVEKVTIKLKVVDVSFGGIPTESSYDVRTITIERSLKDLQLFGHAQTAKKESLP